MPKKNGWDGGHAFGAGRGKSEFPRLWDRGQVRAAIEEVLRSPAQIERAGSTLYFRGTVGGQLITVRVKGRMQGHAKIWTAYPSHD
ncbi:EndoU domain-containing protein [Mycobacterium sp. M1]|uniref:EndoU domain-containing protein n=1 Tax=Mycolicibacter acidiphilus TaxID=2835306 RepID=A0ABS5RR27_9MYCO|nr:EndoU domain-containing protein [Mycolicibacter acidiphilus]MBS9536034.1 EndoU domain-containing protein [Mycolicibacter acidiphilus]